MTLITKSNRLAAGWQNDFFVLSRPHSVLYTWVGVHPMALLLE
jgi:hypothetical protein